MTADCKKPSRPEGAVASSSTAARSPVVSSGCLASILRATQRESLTDRRRPAAYSHAGRDRDAKERQQPAGRNQGLARARADHPEADAGRGPDEPAERQSPDQSRACRKRSSTRSSARRSSVVMSSGPPRGTGGGSKSSSPRQPCFEDKDANDCNDQPAPELLTAFQLGIVHLPAQVVVDTLRGVVRQTNPELLDRLDGQGRGLALEGIEIDGERRRPARCVDRVDAGLRPCHQRTRSTRSIVTDRSVRLLDNDHVSWSSTNGGSGNPFADTLVGRDHPRAAVRTRPKPTSAVRTLTTGRAGCRRGCQPLARTTSLPFPSDFSIKAASLFSNRASTRAVAQLVVVDVAGT